jgi:hypothetical protein
LPSQPSARDLLNRRRIICHFPPLYLLYALMMRTGFLI